LYYRKNFFYFSINKRMSAYSEFVKTHYSKVSHLPNKERFKKLAEMYKAQKGGMKMEMKKDMKKDMKKEKAGILTGAGMSGAGAGMSEGESGSGFLSSALDSIGLGMDMKKARKPRAKKAKGGEMQMPDESGAGFLSSALGAFGLGLDMPKKRASKKKMM
jgi:hypothetical protein